MPFGNLATQRFHQLKVTPGIVACLGFAHHRFAEDVHGKSNLFFMEFAQGGNDFFFLIAEHELPGHAGHLRLHARAEKPARSARRL